MIKIEKLSKKYGDKDILNNINMTFQEGMVYGIVGENGAGKTTLFKCIVGLEKYTGVIESKFNPIKDYSGLLLTDPFIFSKITGKEYIKLLCDARQIKIGDIHERNIFGLPLNQYASTYSTGMKKKLAITALLLQKNKIFILDEPFNGVDIQSNIIITEIIHKLKSLNKIIIISSHIFSTLNETCDQIHVLNKGNLLKTVSKNEFSQLENEMKEIIIDDKIEKMKIE